MEFEDSLLSVGMPVQFGNFGKNYRVPVWALGLFDYLFYCDVDCCLNYLGVV